MCPKTYYSMLENKLLCTICSVKLESEYMQKHGINSNLYHKYANHKCGKSCGHKEIINNTFGILVCIKHKCECKDFPSNHITSCQICKIYLVCSQCEYRRVMNNHLYTNICSSCYHQ